MKKYVKWMSVVLLLVLLTATAFADVKSPYEALNNTYSYMSMYKKGNRLHLRTGVAFVVGKRESNGKHYLLLATANHVLCDTASAVILSNTKRMIPINAKAITVIKRSLPFDFAVVKVPVSKKIYDLSDKFALAKTFPKENDPVAVFTLFLIKGPTGLYHPRNVITLGKVNEIDPGAGWMRLSFNAYHGYSGSPMVNMNWEVVGVIFAHDKYKKGVATMCSQAIALSLIMEGK